MNMNIESKRQELAGRLVQREIFYCVSSLVSTLSNLAQNASGTTLRDECLSWEDDILPLMESINFEEAVRAHVLDGSNDVQTLENMVEIDGDWTEFLEQKVWPVLGKPPKVPSMTADKVCVECQTAIQSDSKDWADHCAYYEISDERSDEVVTCTVGHDSAHYCGEAHDEHFSIDRCDCCGSPLAGERFTYEDPDDMDVQDMDDWLCDDRERDKAFRKIVFKQLEETSDMEELCRECDVDTDDFRDTIYEHWIVSDWLARKLKERGETVGELCGMTIWGRCTTGQSICMDNVIRCIIEELHTEELSLVERENEQSD